MPTPTNDQIIIGMYRAYFLRAPDASGFQTWSDDIAAGAKTMQDISSGFFAHPYSQDTLGYGSMSNTDFVSAIYANVLNGTGDTQPTANDLTFWVNRLEGGESRSEMVRQFLTDSLSIDFPVAGFTDEQNASGQLRQDALYNSIEVGQSFMDILGDATNLSPEVLADPNPDVLINDPTFMASQKIIAGITSDDSSVTNAINFLQNQALGSADPISTIDNASHYEIFGPVQLAGKTDVSGTIGTMDVFVLDFDSSSGSMVATGTQVSIHDFTVGEDLLRFNDISASPATVNEFFAPDTGIMPINDGFDGQTIIQFRPETPTDFDPAPSSVTLVGVSALASAGTNQIDVATLTDMSGTAIYEIV